MKVYLANHEYINERCVVCRRVVRSFLPTKTTYIVTCESCFRQPAVRVPLSVSLQQCDAGQGLGGGLDDPSGASSSWDNAVRLMEDYRG